MILLCACGGGNNDTSGSGGSDPSSGAGGSDGAGANTGSSGGGGSKPPPVHAGKKYPGVSGDAELVTGKWQDITPQPMKDAAISCTDLKFDPSNPSVLYAVFGNGGGIWQSLDGGKWWVQFGDIPMPNGLGRILVDPNDPNHLYTTGGVDNPDAFGFFVSHDGGAHWKIPKAFADGVGTTWVADLYNIVTDPEDFNHILISSHSPWPGYENDAGVLESKDGGETFIAHLPTAGMSHGNGIAFLSDPASGQGDGKTWLVGGGYDPGMFRTTDAGETWKKVSGAQDNHGGFYATYSKQGFLYIGVQSGIDRSTDNGETWTSQTTDIGGWHYGAISTGKELITSYGYVGDTTGQPFSRSPEGGGNEGKTWTPYSDQVLPDGHFRMVFEPEGRIVYNAGWHGGAWALKVD